MLKVISQIYMHDLVISLYMWVSAILHKKMTAIDSTPSVLRWYPNPPTPQNLVGSSESLLFPFAGSPPASLSKFSVRQGDAGGERRETLPSLESASSANSIFLTWENLQVFASRTPLLSGLTGLAQPKELLAIIGPSGCGKSTLLDALAGRLASNLRQTGDILINGKKQTLSFGMSAYVPQDDVLMTTLTVREAIQYAAQLQLPSSMRHSDKLMRAEKIIEEMGLESVADVQIGGRTLKKGISGGQKRRVSICMEIITSPKLLYLDEPTSGLDSAAAFHVINCIVKLAEMKNMTVIAAVHQPGSELFELFHSICVIAYGKTVFFGPRTGAPEFFALNGFPIPSHKNPSDHYLKTINKDFDKDIEKGDKIVTTTTSEAIDLLVRSYSSCITSQQLIMLINDIRKMDVKPVKKRKQTSFLMQCVVLTRRSAVNMCRDLGYYWLRFAIYIAMCLTIGTIFYQIGHSYGSIQARGSMLSFIAAFLTFMAIGGFPSFVEDMKIFKRERLSGYYGVAAFTIANTVSATPYLALISIIPGAIVYYLAGLQSTFGHVFYFVLMLFSCMMLIEGLMMVVASIVPDFLMGIITGAGIQGMMMLNGGFFRLPNDLPRPVWRYPMYHIAFHKYANQGFFKNEFIGLTFPNNQAGGHPAITGKEILKDTWQVETGYSKWVDLGLLLGMVLLYRFLFFMIVKLRERAVPKLNEFRSRAPKASSICVPNEI